MKEKVQMQRRYFHTNETKELSFRMNMLKKLKKALLDYENELLAALKEDLNKSTSEAFLTELGPLYHEITFMLKHLPTWIKRKKVKTPLTHVGSKGYIHYEPYGVVLIIAPWNYPLQLAINPLIGAIAAGNCAIVKPSELTPATSGVITEMIENTFPEEYVCSVEGGVETSQALLAEKMDYIFFTGSVGVGKHVMKAASRHLTPVTLELGGKSPAIVCEDAQIAVTAKRIAWGKFLNAGQTCVAPDYVLVHDTKKEDFLKALQTEIKTLFQRKIDRGDYPTIVSDRHFARLIRFLQDGDVVSGGQHERNKRFIAPTVLTNVSWESPVMEDEIFGPILPVFSFSELDEVIEKVRERPHPLALYLFTESKETEEKLIHSLSFGGGCINDTVMHLATPYLPFGGVGESGMGAYHGEESFYTFSHRKSVLKQPTSVDLPIRYKESKLSLKMLRKLFQ